MVNHYCYYVHEESWCCGTAYQPSAKHTYTNARNRVRVDDTYIGDFNVKVGVHQGSVLSPLLFIIVLETLSKEFRTRCPWELLYTDDLVIVDETMEKVVYRQKVWKDNVEAKGLRGNLSKT